jgi:hypothetical protein
MGFARGGENRLREGADRLIAARFAVFGLQLGLMGLQLGLMADTRRGLGIYSGSERRRLMRYRFKLYGRDFKMTGPDGRPFSTATIAHVARLTRMLAKLSRSEPVRQQGADRISDTFLCERSRVDDSRYRGGRRAPLPAPGWQAICHASNCNDSRGAMLHLIARPCRPAAGAA